MFFQVDLRHKRRIMLKVMVLVFLPLCFITKPDIQIWKDIKYAYTVSSDCPVAWPMFEKIDYSLTHEYN